MINIKVITTITYHISLIDALIDCFQCIRIEIRVREIHQCSRWK